jgi:hypothetical protein
LPADDGSIPDDEILLRRLPPYMLADDEGDAGKRATGNAFLDRDSDGISVFIRSKMQVLGLDKNAVVEGFSFGWGVAEVTVGEARKEGLGVVASIDTTASPHPCNPAHGLITGLAAGNAGKRQARKLSRGAAIVFVRPPLSTSQ